MSLNPEQGFTPPSKRLVGYDCESERSTCRYLFAKNSESPELWCWLKTSLYTIGRVQKKITQRVIDVRWITPAVNAVDCRHLDIVLWWAPAAQCVTYVSKRGGEGVVPG